MILKYEPNHIEILFSVYSGLKTKTNFLLKLSVFIICIFTQKCIHALFKLLILKLIFMINISCKLFKQQ